MKANALAATTDVSQFRKALINTDDDYLASCLAITLTKLIVKTKKQLKNSNKMTVDTLLVICNLMKA